MVALCLNTAFDVFHSYMLCCPPLPIPGNILWVMHVEEQYQQISIGSDCMQGSAQCCVTGPALEHMLQQADTSVLETVMANVSVFARMRSQQKGQVMDLLGSRGLHHNLDGLQRHIPVSECVQYIICRTYNLPELGSCI